MYKSLFFVLSLSAAAGSVLASSDESLEAGFVEVKPSASALDRLFPEKFSTEQMAGVLNKQPLKIDDIGTLSADGQFHAKVAPNSVQMLTGTASSYAAKVSFAHQARFEEGGLVGLYEYTSSYSSLYALSGYAGSIVFPMKLKLEDDFVIYNRHLAQEGPCEVLNLKDSFLGRENDFVSKPGQFEGFGIPEASLFYMIYSNETFFMETGEKTRLQGNAKTYLLMLDQLKGTDHYHQSAQDREADAEVLYKAVLNKKGLIRDQQTLPQYTSVMMSLRKKILKQLGVPMNLVPDISNDDVMKVASGKGLMVVPAPQTKIVNLSDD